MDKKGFELISEGRDFFELCTNSISLATLAPLRLLLSVAMIVGNPVFTSIKRIILEAKDDFREPLLKQLKL